MSVKTTRWSKEEVNAVEASVLALSEELNRSPRAIALKVMAAFGERPASEDDSPSVAPAKSGVVKKASSVKQGRWAQEETEDLKATFEKYVELGKADTALLARRLNRSENAVKVKLSELYPRTRNPKIRAFMVPVRKQAREITNS